MVVRTLNFTRESAREEWTQRIGREGKKRDVHLCPLAGRAGSGLAESVTGSPVHRAAPHEPRSAAHVVSVISDFSRKSLSVFMKAQEPVQTVLQACLHLPPSPQPTAVSTCRYGMWQQAWLPTCIVGLELQPHHKGGPHLTLVPCPSCVTQEQIRTPHGVICSLFWGFGIVAQGQLFCL